MDIDAMMASELKRIGYYDKKTELEQIAIIQHYFASEFTFENLDVLLNDEQLIDEDFLINKLLLQKRGGLCYELNGTLYIVLKALGFDVTLASATIWTGSFWGADRTHSIVLFSQDDQLYLVDSGTGTNLPMEPVLLNGESVFSSAGAFRLRTESTEKGAIIAERLSEDGWIWQYGFDPKPRSFPDELNRSKKMIHEMESSTFNKDLLIAKALPDGTISINNERLNRKWINDKGLVEHEERTDFTTKADVLKAVNRFSSRATFEEVKRYLA